MSLTYSGNRLRQLDPDRFLVTLFAPRAARPYLWALFDLDLDIARTRDVVSDPTLGLIRLQWWRDEIARVYDGGTGREIPALAALAPLIHKGRLDHALFESMIDAREHDLEQSSATESDLRRHVEQVYTPVVKLAVIITGDDASDDDIAVIASAFGWARILQSVPHVVNGVSDSGRDMEISRLATQILTTIKQCPAPKSRFLAAMRNIAIIQLNHMHGRGEENLMAPPPFLALRVAARTMLKIN